jgi:uncharacterized membrane protein YhaH (DUF805 family)
MTHSSEAGTIPCEKTDNVEYSLFQTRGRITRKAFFLRLTLCAAIRLISHAVYVYWAKAPFDYYTALGGGKIRAGAAAIEMRHTLVQTLDFYAIPCILAVFMLIQAAKRAHDANHSSWFLLLPLYNLYLMFAEGTDGNNDYGLVPHPGKKSPEYFRP